MAASLASFLTDGRSALSRSDGSEAWQAMAVLTDQGKESRRLDRGARLFLSAAREAWTSSGLDSSQQSGRSRMAVLEGSSLGAMGTLVDEARLPEAKNRRRARRLIRFMPGAGGAALAQELGIGGPVMHLSAGSVSAAAAIGEAFLMVASGRVDVALAGGGEAPLHPDILATFREAGILSPDPEWPCRPFDVRRLGTVLGEGAGVVVLEAADHARRRGAQRIGVLAGYEMVTEQCGMVAADENGAGVAAAAGAALRMAGTKRLAWIKAHGTGTRSNDLAEVMGLASMLSAELPGVPVTSLKSTVGHSLGASGIVELVAALVALRERCVPATVGSGELDPALPRCDIACSPRQATTGDVLLLSESFGGRTAALVVRPA
jgi:3-oxoacyl-[acyl-carrier-protein] synthase II